MLNLLKKFWADDGGATAIEYGLIASLIAIAAIASMKGVGSHVKLTFGDIANNLSSQ